MVYSRKKAIGRSKDHSMIQVHGQPKALGDGYLNASGNPSSLSIPIPVIDISVPFVPALESEPEPVPTVLAQNHDLNLPIALRKGIWPALNILLPNISPMIPFLKTIEYLLQIFQNL